LGRNGAAHIAQYIVTKGRDALGLIDRAVVHPNDDVAFRIFGWADWEWLAPLPDNDQRACRVNADAADRSHIDTTLEHRFLDRRTDRPPDVVGGLLDDFTGFMIDGDAALGGGQH